MAGKGGKMIFRNVTVMLNVLCNQYVTHKRKHDTTIRFEYCRAPGCLEMRKSARHAYEMYEASGGTKTSEAQFRQEMNRIHFHETGPADTMVIPRPRVTTV